MSEKNGKGERNMKEEKLVKLLDMALDRISDLEAEVALGDDLNKEIDNSNEELAEENENLKRNVADLDEENKILAAQIKETLDKNETLRSTIEELEETVFKLRKINDKHILDSVDAGAKSKWIDILDPTNRPQPNVYVLFSTKTGKVTIGYFDEAGKIHTVVGKNVQVSAWQKMPNPYQN